MNRDLGQPAPLLFHFLRAGLLTKLAKHLALLACVMIAGRRNTEPAAGAGLIFLVVVVAATLNFIAGRLGRRRAAALPVESR